MISWLYLCLNNDSDLQICVRIRQISPGAVCQSLATNMAVTLLGGSWLKELTVARMNQSTKGLAEFIKLSEDSKAMEETNAMEQYQWDEDKISHQGNNEVTTDSLENYRYR